MDDGLLVGRLLSLPESLMRSGPLLAKMIALEKTV